MDRGRRVRLEREEQEKSALKIQALRRGRSARREFEEKRRVARGDDDEGHGSQGKHHHHHHHHRKHHKHIHTDPSKVGHGHGHKHHKHHRRHHHSKYRSYEYNEEHEALVTKLQSMQRGRVARNRTKRYKRAENRDDLEQKAIMIQSLHRGASQRRQIYMRRKQAAEKEEVRMEETRATDDVEGMLGDLRSSLNNGNEEMNFLIVRTDAAVAMQKISRGFLARIKDREELAAEARRLREIEEEAADAAAQAAALASSQARIDAAAAEARQEGEEAGEDGQRNGSTLLVRGRDPLDKYIARAFQNVISQGLAQDLDGVFDLLDPRGEGSVLPSDLITTATAALGLELDAVEARRLPELFGIGRRGAGQDERILFQYRDFVDFCRRQGLYTFDNTAASAVSRNRGAIMNTLEPS